MTEKYPDGFTQEDIKYAELDNDKVVEINYTSGRHAHRMPWVPIN